MRKLNTMLTPLIPIVKLGLLLLMGVSMYAEASFLGFGGTSWKEEVLLHDGSKIIVDRTANRHGPHEIGQRPPIGDQSIRFTMPGTNRQLVWKDEFSNDVSGANFNLMALDVVQGVAYLVLTPAGCLSYNKWGRPNPPYVIFKYQGNEWIRIQLLELPSEIKLPNMLNSSPDEVAEKTKKGGIVSADVIRLENEDFRQPEFKTILREQIANAGGSRCSKMIITNDGWEGLGVFKSKPSYDACLKYCDRKGVKEQDCPCATLYKGK